jgi:hypothetical protein
MAIRKDGEQIPFSGPVVDVGGAVFAQAGCIAVRAEGHRMGRRDVEAAARGRRPNRTVGPHDGVGTAAFSDAACLRSGGSPASHLPNRNFAR